MLHARSPLVRQLRLAMLAAVLLTATPARAQFPIVQSFMNSTAPGWTLLGNAALTGTGGVDPIGSGWLRLTAPNTNEAGHAIFNTDFPSTSGISISFDYADYGGTGADGFSFYLIDGATATPTVGSSGGPLGYAAKYSNATCATGPLTVTIPGVTSGYVGIGFDEFGNYSACESGVASPGRTAQSVAIRGSGTRVAAGGTQTAFRYLAGRTLASVLAGARVDNVQRATPRRAQVSIINQRITVSMDLGAGLQTIINSYDLSTATGQAALPATFKMGLSGSTGGSTNYHEIRNVRVELPANIILGQTVTPASVGVTGTIAFTITITNDATNAALNSALTDAFPAGLSNVAWTTTATGGATVGRASGTGNLSETVNLPKSSSVTYTVTATVTAAAAGQTLSNTVTLTPPSGVANVLSNTTNATVTVSKMGSATALASSGTPTRFGQPVTFTATVTAVAPGSGVATGTVTFLDGATTIGSGALNGSGVATFTTAALAVGTHPITASYGGSAAFLTSVSSGVSQVVNQSLTSSVLTSSVNPSISGQAVTLTATVTATAPGAGSPSGTVTFLDGATTIGTGALNGSGVATFTTAALGVATHSLTASYGGDASFAASTSVALSQVVGQATSATTLVAAPTPALFGEPITLTATVAPVAPGAGAPTGTVTFRDGATTLGVGVLNGSGVATFTTAALSVATHSLTAAYGGDTAFIPSTSTAASASVVKASTGTVVASSLLTSTFGDAVTFTATVAVQAPGAGMPTGTIRFTADGTTLGDLVLDASGQAALPVGGATLRAGAHAIVASYLGDGNFVGSASPSLIQSVARATTTTAVAADVSPSVAGQPVTFTATVSGPGGLPAVTGTVTFRDGATVLGTASLSGGVATLTTGSLAVGPHTLTAASGGDADYAPSTSPGLAQQVIPAGTATSLASSPNPSVFGLAVTLDATVTVPAPGAGTPTGSVTFFDGATAIGSAALDLAGLASLQVTTLVGGSHALSATYGGEPRFNASTSAPVTQSVGVAATSLGLATSKSPAVLGESVTLTATVASAAGTPIGTVTFREGATVLGSAPLTGGVASLAVATLPVGSHALAAGYGGSADFAASTGAVTQVVAQAATDVTVVPAANPVVTGEPVTVQVLVAARAPGVGLPSGTVRLLVDGLPVGTATLAGGSATFTLAPLPVGAHPLTAEYAGDASFQAGTTSAPVMLDALPAVTDTALVSSTPSAVFGEPVTFTATVTVKAPGAGAPTGSVTFTEGTTTLGAAAVNATGQAPIDLSTLAVGGHDLVATYGGDPGFALSVSTPVHLDVSLASSAATVVAAPSPSVVGQPVVFTVTVSPVAPSTATPTGDVTLREGTTVLGTATLSGGTATITTAALGPGPHDLAADFAGDAGFGPVTSPALTHRVDPATTSTALSAAPNPSLTGEPVQLTATVTVTAPGAGTPSGTVTFLDGATVLGTAPVDPGGVATLVAAFGAGAHALVAGYGGDASLLASGAPTLVLDVGRGTVAVALGAAPSPSTYGDAVTLTATVAAVAPAAGAPGGDVLFTMDGVAVGSATLSGGVATLALLPGALNGGVHLFGAATLGDAGFSGAAAPPFTQLVGPAVVGLALAAASPAPVAGEPVVLTATAVSGAGVPAGLVTFTDGGVTLGAAALGPAGVAVLAVGPLAVGSHALAAAVDASPDWQAASASAALTVARASSTVSVVSAPAEPALGQAVTFTVAVAAVAPGAAVPSGTVSLYDGATLLGTATVDATGHATLVTSALAVGAHDVTVSYGGDAALAPSTSAAPLPVLVGRVATATTLVAAPAASTFGTAVSFTATVTASGPGTITGSVTFTDGVVTLGVASLDAGGMATLALPGGALRAGVHPVAARYGGDPSFFGSSSAPATASVARAPSLVALVASPSPATAGGTVTLTATVTSTFGTPGGTVTFSDGASVLGVATLGGSGQPAVLTTSALTPGSHALSAAASGDADYAAGSGAATLSVVQGATTVAVTTSRNPSRRGRPITFTATVTGPHATPTGSVTFRDLSGATPVVLGTATLAGGQATLTTRALLKGVHPIAVAYSGDASNAPSTGVLPADEVVENTPPVAGSGTALALGVPAAPGSAARATVDTSGGALDQPGGTVELWFRTGWSAPTEVGATPSLARLAGAGAARWALGVAPDRAHLLVTLGGVTTSVSAPIGGAGWHHLALIGGATSSTLLLDGVEVGQLAEPFGGVASATLTLGEGFFGQLDEVRAWSTARSAAELSASARSPLRGDEAGIIGLWRLDEGSGLEIFDASSSHLDGALALVDPAAPPAPFTGSTAWASRQAVTGRDLVPVDAGYDADGDPLTLTIATPATNGAATPDGAVIQVGYRSQAGWTGTDPFTFRLDDGAAVSDYTIEVTVVPVPACQSSRDCASGEPCVQGACTTSSGVELRAGGCGCTSGGGGALALWSLLALAFTRRRRARLAGAEVIR